LEGFPVARKPTHGKLEQRMKELGSKLLSSSGRKRGCRNLRKKYRRLFENPSDAIFIADTKTHIILDANRRAERLTGRRRKEIIGMQQSKLHPPDHAEYYEGKFRRHVQKGRVFGLETEIITKDGRVVPVFIRASVISIHGKEVMQVLFGHVSEESRVLKCTMTSSHDKKK